MSVLISEGQPTLKIRKEEIIRSNKKLRRLYLKTTFRSEEERSLLESKLQEIEQVIKEINRNLKYADSLRDSPENEEFSQLKSRFEQAKLSLQENQFRHQQHVKKIKSEIGQINIVTLRMSREVDQLDQQLSGQQLPPTSQKKKRSCCESCLIS